MFSEQHIVLDPSQALTVFIATPLADAQSLMTAERLLVLILYSVDKVCIISRAISSPFRLLDSNFT